MARRVPVIINDAAGTGGNDRAREVEQAFRAVDLEAEVAAARPGEGFGRTIERVARERPPMVVAAGGDGTINAVAAALAGTDIALGVLPLGTLNHFAKDLRIPLELDDAARTIAQGHCTAVDVGEVNGRIFLNNSSLGLYPQIVRGREKQQNQLGRGKWPALVWATWTALRRSPFLRLKLLLDERETQCVSTFVFIGNNEYVMEGLSIGMRKRLDEGRLSVYITRRSGRLGLILLGLRAFFGRLRQADDFDATTAHTLTVETPHRRLHVATDGEVTIMDTPLEYRVRPHALRVIVPKPE